MGKLKRLTLLDASRNCLGADDRAGMSDADVDADADACGGLAHLAGCVTLAALKVDGNARVTRLPPILGALTKLATVSCDGTGVRAVPPEILAGCASLKALSARVPDRRRGAERDGRVRCVRGEAKGGKG